MGAGHAGAEGIGAAAGADAPHLVGGNGHAHAGAAHQNAPLGAAVPDKTGNLGGLFGIIALFAGFIDPKVLYFVPQLLQMLPDRVFQGQGGMVAAYGNFHIATLLW